MWLMLVTIVFKYLFKKENTYGILEKEATVMENWTTPPVSTLTVITHVVYVTEAVNHRVSLFTLEGKFLTSFGSKGDGLGQFNHPCGITVDNQGIIYVADYDNNRIQIFTNPIKSLHKTFVE